MILWCDGAHDAPENMRRDAALLEALVERTGERTAVLRLFRFDPPGITLGRARRPERELDLERCQRDGVSWAVRPTGGGAILHAEEWTYSLAAALADPVWGGSRRDASARITRLVHASLLRLGVPARLAEREAGEPAREGEDAACFAVTARHEIVLGGRKLVGSAQRRTATTLLQQGSVLLGDGHLRLADYLAGPGEGRARARAALAAASTGAGRHLGADRTLERWATAIEIELGSGVRRLDAAAGAFLLTLGKAGSYTPSIWQ